MTTNIDISELEKLFRAISVKKASDQALKKLEEYPERNQCIQFLIAKLRACHRMAQTDGPWDSKLENGSIHACRLLGKMKAEAAIGILIETLDSVKENFDLIIFSASLLALGDIGPPVLEPVYAKYEEDIDNQDNKETWLDILTRLGVRDSRIKTALHDFFRSDPIMAISYMGSYGDREFLPLVEKYVHSTVRHLNMRKIDPRAPFARLADPMVHAYIETRETLVRLREDIDFDHPDFDRRVELLDSELLTTNGPWDTELSDGAAPFVRPSAKIGRNDPCPCGSGKKYKKCCGKA
jgi:hypothetical protein